MILVVYPDTLPETNSSPLKMDGWSTSFLFLLGWPIFRCNSLVSGSVIFMFTPIPGEMIQFDDIIFFKGVETTNQFLRVFYPAIGVPNGNSYI